MKKIIVCGAGIGGMVSAILLAAKGNEVEIFEKNLTAGGKMNEFNKDGFRFDTGPSLITMPFVFEEFFRLIDRKMEDYFVMKELESSCKYFWQDSTILNSYSDNEKFRKELTEVFGENEKNNFFKYLDYGKIFYDLSKNNFLGKEFSIRDYITLDGLKNFSKFISGRSVNDVSNKFFKSNKLKQLMDRYATYNGSTPYMSPQFFSIIPYVEYKFGSWYVSGGIYNIAKALTKLCTEFNININFGHELTDIEIKSKNISKLIFAKTDKSISEISEFDEVISNFTNDKNLSEEEYFENDDWSCSGFILLLGVDKQYKELSHHNILFSDNYEKEFIDIFEKKIPADDMTIYISISNKEEGKDAPDGCDNWFVLVNAPYLSKTFDWTDENKNIYKNKVIDRIDNFSFLFDESIRNHIMFSEIFTPLDFQNKYNSENGSIYGLSSNSLYTLLKRPKNKSAKFRNLYFTGGNTHPGGGVPLCFLSGKIVSEII